MEIAFLSPEPAPIGGGAAFNAGLVAALRAAHHLVVAGTGLDTPGLPVIDGMLLPTLEPDLDALLARDAVLLVHHVSAAAGRDAAARQAVGDAERRMLPRLRRVVATSQPVADRLRSDFGVPAPFVLHPGQPVLPRSAGAASGGCRILDIGVLTPRKGHDRLLAALARLTDLDWTLTIAGDARRDPVHAATLAARLDELNLNDRVSLLPDPDEADLDALWPGADLFATATAWEGYPAALAGAMRRGIPVVAPRLPGIEAVIPASAGILFPPDDAATFGKCLRRAIFDTALRQELADGAWTAGLALPDWTSQGQAFEAILKG